MGEVSFSSVCFLRRRPTIIAVFENILKMTEELTGWDRKKSVRISFILVFLLSLPCALGFNLFNFIQPFGTGTTIQDL